MVDEKMEAQKKEGWACACFHPSSHFLLPCYSSSIHTPRIVTYASLLPPKAVVAASAVSYLRIVSVVFPISAVETAYEGALAGAGDTVPTLLSGLLLNTARIPLAAALAAAGGGNGGGGLLGRLGVSGVSGVWVAIAATTVAQAATKQLAFRFSSLPAATGSTTKTEPARRKQ